MSSVAAALDFCGRCAFRCVDEQDKAEDKAEAGDAAAPSVSAIYLNEWNRSSNNSNSAANSKFKLDYLYTITATASPSGTGVKSSRFDKRNYLAVIDDIGDIGDMGGVDSISTSTGVGVPNSNAVTGTIASSGSFTHRPLCLNNLVNLQHLIR